MLRSDFHNLKDVFREQSLEYIQVGFFMRQREKRLESVREPQVIHETAESGLDLIASRIHCLYEKLFLLRFIFISHLVHDN